MNDQVVKLLMLIGAALVLMGIGATGAWMWQANSYGTIIAKNEENRQADLTLIANASAAQARQALEKLQLAEQALADLDQKHQKEKTDGLAENETLRLAAADSARRLRIAGGCRAGGGDVPGTTSAAGLGDAGTVELSTASGSVVFDIRAGIIADQAALRALQSYVAAVCLRK